MQLTACLALLVGAGLLLRSVMGVRSFDPGFNPAGVFRVYVSAGNRDVNARLSALLAERVRALPQIKAVSQADLFMAGNIELVRPGRQGLRAAYNGVTPEFFLALQLPLLRGRHFTGSEVASEAPVTIINESAARLLFAGQNPVGRRVEIQVPVPGPGLPRRAERVKPGALEVIGVTRDMKLGPPRSEREERPRPILYLPKLPDPADVSSLLVRAEGNPQNAAQAIRGELAALAPGALLSVLPVSEYVNLQLRIMRQLLATAASLGGLGLLLATIGLYGITSHMVTQRTQEIGIRVALGARTQKVLWLILGRALKLAFAGAATGLLLAALLSRMIGPYLYRVNRYDPLTYTVVPTLLILVCLLAAYIPARRATRLDPIVALRHE